MTDRPPTSDALPLLLCIDLQPSFLQAIPDGPGVLRRCAFAIESARGLALPVWFTEQVPDKLGPTESGLTALVEQPVRWAKDEFSALANPDIRAALRERPTGHVLLAGIETSVCVFQTARDALAAGLKVTVLADCVGARRADDAAVALAQLARLGAAVLPAETEFYSLLGSARHPFFRAYTKLVKHYSAAPANP